MMSQAIPIAPYPINRSIDHVKVFIDNFELLATSGSATIYEYDASDTLLNVSRVPIPADVWLEWGTDDLFIIDYVVDILGFERRPDASPVLFPE